MTSTRGGRSAPRTVVILAGAGIEAIDVVGPYEVFSATNRLLVGRGGVPAYRVCIAAERAGPFRAASGLGLLADLGLRDRIRSIDTLVVTGALDFDVREPAPATLKWLEGKAARARRVVSVCTGAFLLARIGLLDGRRATTHWLKATALASQCPRAQLDADAIFVRDGHVWTSAGATAGMDLSLSLVRDDLGPDVAHTVARLLVLFMHRPGGQSQFSAALAHAPAEDHRILDVQTFVLEHPEADLRVPTLAKRAGMSPRNFARVFATQTGDSVGSFVATARLQAAKRLLEGDAMNLDEVASKAGYGSAETMRRAFHRHAGINPSSYRERFFRQ